MANVDLSCAISAGGKASRMGGLNKALISIQGKSILDRNLEVITEFFDEIILITPRKDEFEMYLSQITIVEDIIPNRGPISGLHSALSHCNHQAVFFMAADMPNLSPDFIKKLIQEFHQHQAEALVIRINGKLEPLQAIYSVSIKEKLENYLNASNNNALKDFIQLLNVRYLELDFTQENLNALTNINYPDQLNF
jgi:molybdopterin-guanine dinucleotide biosynthesis protein A